MGKMITTLIAWCFMSTGWWYDTWPQVDELRNQWYTECYNYNTDKKWIYKIKDLWNMYRPYDNIQWSNGFAYWVGNPVNTKDYLLCDLKVESYFDQEELQDWVKIK